MKSRGAGLAVALSVLPAARLAPAAAAACVADGWVRLAVEPAEAPGAEAPREGAEASIVTGLFAHPLATMISIAAGITRTLRID
jgi:hypothetical protein